MRQIHFVRPATRDQAAALLFSVVGPFEGQNIGTLTQASRHRVKAAMRACNGWFDGLSQSPIALAPVRCPPPAGVHHG